ncbi:ATP-binding protein [Flavobacterium chungangensis]|uniref:ATP-binding protein n=1 Tax=Flavobacterium chungangensis TaxID=2708132 RepID=A0ABV8ZG00_9FLAO
MADNKNNKIREVATPKQTGGGGFVFEHKVTAWFCAHFLADAIALSRGLGKITRIDFQVRAEGWLFDDLLLTQQNVHGEISRTAVSVKSNIQFNTKGPSKDLVNDLWNQYVGEPQKVFDPARDYLCIVNSLIRPSISSDLTELIAIAKEMDPKTFAERISKDQGGFSKTKRRLFEGFNAPPELASKYGLTQEDTVLLLGRLFFLEFDFEKSNSTDENSIIAMAKEILSEPDGKNEIQLYESLCTIGSELSPVSGFLDYKKLIGRFRNQYDLKGFPNHVADWRKIYAKSNAAVSAIRDSIGGKVNLPRTEEIDELRKAIDKNKAVFVLGRSGCGKSALVKKLVERESDFENNYVWIDSLSIQKNNLAEFFGLQHNIGELFERIQKPCSFLVIDGIDRFFKEDDLRILHEMLEAALQPESQWKIIFTCQNDDYGDVVERFFRINLPFESESCSVELDILKHLELFYKEIPELSDLFKHKHLLLILNNLKYLDLLAVKLLSGRVVPESAFLGETTIIDWIWKEEFDSTGSRFMQVYAEKQAQMFSTAVPVSEFSINELMPLDRIKQGKIIYENDDKLFLSHDLLGDWARYKLLRSKDLDLKSYLLSLELGSPLWRKAIRLYGIYLLDKNDLGSSWKTFMKSLSELEPAEKIVQDLLLESIFFSADPFNHLSAVYDLLKEDQGKLFDRFMGQFLIKATRPNQEVLHRAVSQGIFTATEAASYFRVPDYLYWPSLIVFLYDFRKEVIIYSSKKIAALCLMWLNNTSVGVPFRKEVAQLALENARKMFDFKFNNGHAKADEDKFVYKAFLAAANEYTKEVTELALKLCKRIKVERNPVEDPESEMVPSPVISLFASSKIRDKIQWPDGPYENVDREFQKVCLDENALTPLIAACPEAAMEVILALLIERPKEVSFGYGSSHYNLDIKDPRGWFPPFYTRGPFLAFFRLQPLAGLNLVLKFVNFAAQQWTNDFNHKNKPVPSLQMNYDGAERKYIGDFYMYYWFRDATGAPHSVVSALQALEKFLMDEIDKANDIGKYIDLILKEGASVAFLGVLNSLGKYKAELYLGPLADLLPVVDFYFLEKDLDFRGTGIEGHQLIGSQSFDSRTRELAAQWHNMPQRNRSMGGVCITLFLKEVQLQQLYREIRKQWTILLDGIKDDRRYSDYLKRLISFFDLDNYIAQGSDPDSPLIYKEPKSLSKELESARSDAELGFDLLVFPFKCLQGIKNGTKLNAEECSSLWDTVLNISQVPDDIPYLSYGGSQQCFLAGCAFLFYSRENWIDKHPDRVEWMIAYIENAVRGYQPQPNSFYQTDMGDSWSAFAARILSFIWSSDLNSIRVRGIIAMLAVKCPYDTLSILFYEMAERLSWSEANFVQLQNLVILNAVGTDRNFSSAIPDYGFGESAAKAERFDYSKYIDEITQDFIYGRTEKKLISWAEIRSVRPKTINSWNPFEDDFAKSPGISKEMLHHAFVVVPDLDGLEVEDSKHLCQLLKQLYEQLLFEQGPAKENFSDRSEYPDEFDVWLLGKISRLVLDDEALATSLSEELWKPLFLYGPQMADAIIIFMESFFINNLVRDDKKTNIYATWLAMIDFAEKCKAWKVDRHYSGKDIHHALLGINGTMIKWWTADEYSFFYDKAILEVIKWAQNRRYDQDTVYRILILMRIKPGMKHIREGLDIVVHYLELGAIGDKIEPRKGFVRVEFAHENYLAGTASFLWENCAIQFKSDKQLFLRFKKIVTYLVSRQNPIGLELQDRILLS